jgi:hypothetical protein
MSGEDEAEFRRSTYLICYASSKSFDICSAALFTEKPGVHFKNLPTQLPLGQDTRRFFCTIKQSVDQWSPRAVRCHTRSSGNSSARYFGCSRIRVRGSRLVVGICNE